jgi:hypothetical protein
LCRILSRLHLGAGSGDPRTVSLSPRLPFTGRGVSRRRSGTNVHNLN